MRAAFIEKYGSAEVLQLGEQPVPQPGPNDVRVRVHCASVNPVDFKVRAGAVKLLLPYRLPLILGNDLSGVVDAVGTAVTTFKVGDRVAARVEKSRGGAFAEYAVLNPSVLAPIPTGVADADAAAVALAGLTAWQCLTEVLKLKAGQSILIHAGAGGVGHLAIQLAKRLGAQVITTASTPKFEMLRALGADVLIDYRSTPFESACAPVDAVLDTQGGEVLLRSLKHVKPGGSVVSIGGIPTPEVADEFGRPGWVRWLLRWATRRERALARARGVAYRYWFMRPDGVQLAQLLAWLASGELRVQIEREFNLEQIHAAMVTIEQGRTSGKIVVQVTPSDAVEQRL